MEILLKVADANYDYHRTRPLICLKQQQKTE